MTDHVEVLGTGAATASPDLVVLDLRLGVTEPEVAAALDGCARVVGRVVDAAEAHGIQARDRQSTGIGVHPQYDQHGQRVVGYTAWQTLRLASRERARVGDLLTAVAAAAGNAFGLDNVSLRIGDTSALLTAAREAAFADAHAKAEQYAALAGRRLGAVLRVREVPEGGGVMPVAYGAGKRMAMDTAASMPVEGGESEIAARVAVRWELR